MWTICPIQGTRFTVSSFCENTNRIPNRVTKYELFLNYILTTKPFTTFNEIWYTRIVSVLIRVQSLKILRRCLNRTCYRFKGQHTTLYFLYLLHDSKKYFDINKLHFLTNKTPYQNDKATPLKEWWKKPLM